MFVSRVRVVRVANPVLRFRQRRLAGAGRLEIFERGRFERQLGFGERLMFSIAPDDREWFAPITLPREKPVPQLVTDVAAPMAVLLQPVDDLGRRLLPRESIEQAAN